MSFQITSYYAAAMGVLALALSFHVIARRASSGISLNDGGDLDLAERIRRHGNFCEYVPLALILLAMAEASGAGRIWLHVSGGLLVAARLVHPFGIKRDNASAPARIAGAAVTQLSMAISIVLIVWLRMAG